MPYDDEERYNKRIQRMPLHKDFHKEFKKLSVETGKDMIDLSKEFADDPEDFFEENVEEVLRDQERDDDDGVGLGGKLFG